MGNIPVMHCFRCSFVRMLHFFSPTFYCFFGITQRYSGTSRVKESDSKSEEVGGGGWWREPNKTLSSEDYEAENFHSLNCRNKCLLCERESFLVSLLSFSLWLRLLIENAAAQNNNLHDSKDVNTFQNTPMGFEFFPLTIGAIAPKLSKCKLFPHTNRNCQTRKSTNNNGRERREEKKIMP